MVKKVLGSCILFLMIVAANGQTAKEKWVDSVFRTMNLPAKYGQIMMVSVSPDAPEDGLNEIERKIKNTGIGGILFKPGSLRKQVELTNRFQSISDVPLFIAVEGNAGCGRWSDTLSLQFPPMVVQGALTSDTLITSAATGLGKKFKALGVNLNLMRAKVSAPANYDAFTSYGENRLVVARKDLAYVNAIQSQGIVACAEDFPMHTVKVNSVEKGSPGIELIADSTELFPYRELLRNGTKAVMVDPSELPMFYGEKKVAIKSLFSGGESIPAFAANWLRRTMNFNGAIFINLDDMTRGSDKFEPGEAEVFAFEAGNDMLVTSGDLDPAFRKFKKYFKKEKDLRPQLDESVKRILGLKYDAGLSKEFENISSDIFKETISTENKLLQKQLYRHSVTVVKNETNILPVKALDEKRFFFIAADDSVKGVVVSEKLLKYAGFVPFYINEKKELPELNSKLQPKHVVVIAVFPSTKEETLQKLSMFATANTSREVIICDFGSAVFKDFAQFFPNIVNAYTDDAEMLQIVPEIVFGGLPALGTLPVTYGKIAPGASVKTNVLNRLTYSFPEEVQIDSKTLNQIDAIAQEAIAIKGTPGCHVLVARKGKVIYEKSFGYLTYENQVAVTDHTIYDLASVTKVAATLQTVMFMQERGLIDINKKASVYLPELKNSNKKDFTIKDILTHQAGLWPFLPFWAQTMKDSQFLPEYYNDSLSAKYPLVIADHLYGRATMKDSLWSWIIKAKIREKPARTPFDYKYSDMGFYIAQHLAERLLNQPIEDFTSQNFYEPLGAHTTGYLPLLRFPLNQIAPTENDKLFRKSLLIGMVHDQGAAMHGGVAGHAGLFSTANDLAKLGQMLLQQGQYGGIRYYKPETVKLFTQKQFDSSRRGLGWDKPTPGDWNGPTSYYSSPGTFGHTGFTGTCIWVDPEFDLVYIFLSNRVHPDMTNNKLLNANIRSRIQDTIYQAIFNYCKTAGGEPAAPLGPAMQALGQSQ